LRFIWFWTFWHWSKESFESGSLLRSPIHGIGGHWDEWFRHDASASDRDAVSEVGRSVSSQRAFIRWLVRHWSREAHWRRTSPPIRFILGQLAHFGPFDRWAAFDRYRTSYGIRGLSAIVLSEGSEGEATDVRVVEALALPADADSTAPSIVTEEFEVDSATLAASQRAAASLLGGRGLLSFLAFWAAAGRRPYSTSMRVALLVGWLVALALIGVLLVIPDPGEQLATLVGVLVGLWGALVVVGLTVLGFVMVTAWRVGRRWRRTLLDSQIRLRMNGGLQLHGGSAGLAFCLSALMATDRARARDGSHSWLLRQALGGLRRDAKRWAATGVIAPSGRLEPVIIEPKVRALMRQTVITDLLLPWQRDGAQDAIDRGVGRVTEAPAQEIKPTAHAAPRRLGFAAQRRLRGHRSWNVAQALMSVGRLTSRTQVAANVLAVVVSGLMIMSAADWLSIVRPPPAPSVTAPSSPSPYFLWVSLDTEHPRDFWVVLESDFWANRRAELIRYGGVNASVRAEVRLNRLRRQARSEEDGTVWVERRRHFLGREFAPGERVGRYDLSYINRLRHD
jgi:hypothetical protein